MPWIRAAIIAVCMLGWRWQTLLGAARNHSRNHYPYAGPFLVFDTNQIPTDLAIGIGLLLSIVVCALLWIRSGSWRPLAMMFLAVAASIVFSMSTAYHINC